MPNANSCIRLMATILEVISEGWITGRLYLKEPMKKLEEWRSENMIVKCSKKIFKRPAPLSSAGL